MAAPTPVNPQITDSVTQDNTKVLGQSPANAMGQLFQNTPDSVALQDQNIAPQQANQTTQ